MTAREEHTMTPTDVHQIMERRWDERNHVASTARDLHRYTRESPTLTNEDVRKYIKREDVPPKPDARNLRAELIEILKGVQRPMPHGLPCGQDDAWAEKRASLVRWAGSLARYVASLEGLAWEHEPVLSYSEHQKVGARVCPYCVSLNTGMCNDLDVREPAHRMSVWMERHCSDCGSDYEILFTFTPEEEA